MRWIFVTLVVINMVAFAVGLIVSPGSRSQVQPLASKVRPNPYQNLPGLMLLSEMKSSTSNQVGAAKVQRTAAVDDDKIAEATQKRQQASFQQKEQTQQKQQRAPQPSPPSQVNARVQKPTKERRRRGGQSLCEMVGPFKSRSAADEFNERLQAIEIKAALKDIELPAGIGYWVYLEPVATRKEALRHLAELQAQKVDSYVIPKGELANGISLGMFSRKVLSGARVKEMESLGLKPKVEEIERSYNELWVMLELGEGDKMSEYSWKNVLDGLNLVERRENYCLDVAS